MELYGIRENYVPKLNNMKMLQNITDGTLK